MDKMVTHSANKARNIVTIPLCPSLETVNDKVLHKVLLSEYTARYLERIGAEPTKSNMELVQQNVPLTEECVKAQLKSRGAIKDEVSIMVPKVSHEIKRPELSLAPSMQSVLLTKSLAKVAEERKRSEGDAESQSAAAASIAMDDDDKTERVLERAAHNFVYPFTLQKRSIQISSEDATNSDLSREEVEARSHRNMATKVLYRGAIVTGQPTTDSAEMMNPKESGRNRRSSIEEEASRMHQAELKLEMAQDFKVTEEIVYQIQAEFENSLLEWRQRQPEEASRKKLTSRVMDDTLAEIGSESVVRLFQNTAHYLYDFFLHQIINEVGLEKKKAEQRRIVVDMHEGFGRLRHRCQRYRQGLTFTLPIVLLSMRTFVETVFTKAFPTWAATVGGAKTLDDMNLKLTELFDPHGYLSDLSILRSSSEAISIMRRHPHKAHRRIRNFNDTSPLLRAIIGETPKCWEARTILSRSSLAKSVERDPMAAEGTEGMSQYKRLLSVHTERLREDTKLRRDQGFFTRETMKKDERAGWLKS